MSVAMLEEEQAQESGTRDAESTEAFREWENLHPVTLVENSTRLLLGVLLSATAL